MITNPVTRPRLLRGMIWEHDLGTSRVETREVGGNRLWVGRAWLWAWLDDGFYRRHPGRCCDTHGLLGGTRSFPTKNIDPRGISWALYLSTIYQVIYTLPKISDMEQYFKGSISGNDNNSLASGSGNVRDKGGRLLFSHINPFVQNFDLDNTWTLWLVSGLPYMLLMWRGILWAVNSWELNIHDSSLSITIQFHYILLFMRCQSIPL